MLADGDLLSHHRGLQGRIGKALDTRGSSVEVRAGARPKRRSLFLQECASGACAKSPSWPVPLPRAILTPTLSQQLLYLSVEETVKD